MDTYSSFKQYDRVKVTKINKVFEVDKFFIREPRVGDIATIVEIYNNNDKVGLGFTLECTDGEGRTYWLETITVGQLEFVSA